MDIQKKRLNALHNKVAKLYLIYQQQEEALLARKLLTISYQLLIGECRASKAKSIKQFGFYLQKLAVKKGSCDLYKNIKAINRIFITLQ